MRRISGGDAGHSALFEKNLTLCATRGLYTSINLHLMGKGKRNQGGAGPVGGQSAYYTPNQPYQGPAQGNQGWQPPYNPSKPYQEPLSGAQRSNLRQQIIFAAGDSTAAFGSNSRTPCTIHVKIRSVETTPDDVVREFTLPSTEIPHSDHVARHVRTASAFQLQSFCKRTKFLTFLFSPEFAQQSTSGIWNVCRGC